CGDTTLPSASTPNLRATLPSIPRFSAPFGYSGASRLIGVGAASAAPENATRLPATRAAIVFIVFLPIFDITSPRHNRVAAIPPLTHTPVFGLVRLARVPIHSPISARRGVTAG